MRALICGGRDYGVGKPDEWLAMFRSLSTLHEKYWFDLIIEGGAPGADAGAQAFAVQKNIEIKTYKADWDTHGKAAGPIRNQKMIDEGKPDIVIAFPGGRGTQDMISRAKKAGIKVEEMKL